METRQCYDRVSQATKSVDQHAGHPDEFKRFQVLPVSLTRRDRVFFSVDQIHVHNNLKAAIGVPRNESVAQIRV